MPFGTAQVLIRSDFLLPAAAIKFFRVTAAPHNTFCALISDKVIFSGILVLDISWVRAADNQVLVTEETSSFSGFIDILGVAPGMGCQVFPDVEYVAFRQTGPQTLQTTAILFIDIVVNDTPFNQFEDGITRVFDLPGFARVTS
jgi:hypothetical protein